MSPIRVATQRSRSGPSLGEKTTDEGVQLFRYTDRDLLALYARCGVPVTDVSRTPDGREMIISSKRAIEDPRPDRSSIERAQGFTLRRGLS